MDPRGNLPESLVELPYRQAANVRQQSFDADVVLLAGALKRELRDPAH